MADLSRLISKISNNHNAQVPIDDVDDVATIHTHKLDADQYSAEDLSGDVSDVFGSGGVAYA